MGNLGKNIDVVGGIFDKTMLELRHCEGLELSCEPFCCAVSIYHRLAAKDWLKITDLYGENLMLMRRDWSAYVDRLRDDVWKNHPLLKVIPVEWNHSIPYGLLHSPQPPETVRQFLEAVRLATQG